METRPGKEMKDLIKFDMETVAALSGFGAIDPLYHCEECKKEIEKKEWVRNNNVCDYCAQHMEIK